MKFARSKQPAEIPPVDWEKSAKLKVGVTVWIWIVRLGKGRWWPGTVESVRNNGSTPRFVVRFECRRADGRSPLVMVGITTTVIRYLEIRETSFLGADRPRHTPVSLLVRDEDSV